VVHVDVKNGEQANEESHHEGTPRKDRPKVLSAAERAEKKNRDEDTEHQDMPLEGMKKVQLIEKLKETQDLADKNYDLYVRSQAEMENLKKRFQRDKDEWVKFSNESLIKELLPVLDNLEQAILHANNENAIDALREGVELTLKALKDRLGKAGLVEIHSVGRPFDPNVHEAMAVQEDPESDPGTVLQEVQKGYMLNDRLIRPAMVIVNRSQT